MNLSDAATKLNEVIHKAVESTSEAKDVFEVFMYNIKEV